MRLSTSRIGLTASRKVGKSVQRNICKRNLREIARKLRPEIKPGYDIVVNFTKSGVTMAQHDLKHHFIAALRQLEILKESSPTSQPSNPLPDGLSSDSLPSVPAPNPPQQHNGRLPTFLLPSDPLCPPDPSLAARFALAFLRSYKSHISPLLPPLCRYHPTCSEYAMEAFRKKTFFHALGLTIWRLLRCNPFSRGGYDPVE